MRFDTELCTVLETIAGQPSSVVQSQPATTPPAANQPASQDVDQFANTATFNQPPASAPMHQQWTDAMSTREQLKADYISNLPIDKKIELALTQSKEAEKVAYRTLRDLSAINSKIDRVFKDLSGMIGRVSGGKPAVEPDPHGSSIWDEPDPESIF